MMERERQQNDSLVSGWARQQAGDEPAEQHGSAHVAHEGHAAASGRGGGWGGQPSGRILLPTNWQVNGGHGRRLECTLGG